MVPYSRIPGGNNDSGRAQPGKKRGGGEGLHFPDAPGARLREKKADGLEGGAYALATEQLGMSETYPRHQCRLQCPLAGSARFRKAKL